MTFAASSMPAEGAREPARAADAHSHGEALLRDGVVLMEDVIEPALLEDCAAFIAPEGDYAALGEGAQRTNRGRFFTALAIDGPLADPQVFANPAVLALAHRVLDGDVVLDSFGLIVSLPGSAAQHPHVDGCLFPTSPVEQMLPPYALTLAMPLVRMDERSGTTALHRRSHRGKGGTAPDCMPVVEPGSALVWDYRTRHFGQANRSPDPRPVLFAVYCRSWWQDAANFDGGRARKLTVAPGVRDALDPHRDLLARAGSTLQ